MNKICVLPNRDKSLVALELISPQWALFKSEAYSLRRIGSEEDIQAIDPSGGPMIGIDSEFSLDGKKLTILEIVKQFDNYFIKYKLEE